MGIILVHPCLTPRRRFSVVPPKERKLDPLLGNDVLKFSINCCNSILADLIIHLCLNVGVCEPTNGNTK